MQDRRYYLRLRLITPRGELIDCDVFDVVFPAHDGLYGVMSMHAPMLAKLGMGILTYTDFDHKDRYVFVEGGFARISENEVRIITQYAVLSNDIVKGRAQEQLRQAEVMAAATLKEMEARRNAIQRAKFLIKLADGQS